ncbi:MAG: hypothetical protein EZS28_044258, partial [Streblomastix strix]
VGTILKEEGLGYARRSLESSAAIKQGMAMLINDAARNETDNIVRNMLKVFKTSLILVVDAQIERESRLNGVYKRPQIEDVLSQHTQERFKRKSGKQINIGRRRSFDPDKYGKGEYVGEILPQTLSNNQMDKMKLNNNNVENHLKKKCKIQQFIQESMYPPQMNLSNIDLQYLNHQIPLVDTTRIVSASPIGITIPNIRNQPDFTQQLFSDQQYQNSELPANIKSQFCQFNYAQTNWPIDRKLIHFLDVWKLIKADVLITRRIKAYWINKQASQIQELNMTVPNQRKSKQSELALRLLIQRELQEEIVDEVSFYQLKQINPCFAIPKKDKGKWRMITDCSLLNQHLLSSHFIMEDIQSLQQLLQAKDFI